MFRLNGGERVNSRRIAQLSAVAVTLAAIASIDVPSSWGNANTQLLASSSATTATQSLGDEEGRLLAGDIPPEVMRDFQQLWPNLTSVQIHDRWASGDVRAKLSEAFVADPAFAGVDYDFQADQFAVLATDPETVNRFVASAATQGQKARGEVVQRNYAELRRIRDQAEQVLIREKIYELSINWGDNDVAAVVTTAGADLVRELEAIPGVRVTVSDSIPRGEPAACSSRYNCGGPLRGGVNFGRFVSGASLVGCSIGFTTTATDGSRWFYTAGHCILQAQVDAHVQYGHGVQPIGDARSTYNVGAVDVAKFETQVRIGSLGVADTSTTHLHHRPTWTTRSCRPRRLRSGTWSAFRRRATSRVRTTVAW